MTGSSTMAEVLVSIAATRAQDAGDPELAIILNVVLGSLKVPEFKTELCAIALQHARRCIVQADVAIRKLRAEQVLCGKVAE